MARETIDPISDPTVTHCFTQLNGKTYHYLLGVPEDGNYKATIFLVHGFQDLSFGWRYQWKTLISHGLRVVAIDCMGYGRTDAPPVPPESIRLYGFRRAADDIKALATKLGASKIILGGHDWGGMVVTRVYLYYPELVSHIFTLGTPYIPPNPEWLDMDGWVKKYPTFKYQRQFGGPELEEKIKTKEEMRQFFIATFGGRGPNGELPFTTERALMENWPILIPSTILSESELEFYADQYTKRGLHGALNWYRGRRENYEDELIIDPATKIKVPFLYVLSLKDPFLPAWMSEGMEDYIPDLRRREVDAGHFCHILDPETVNKHISDWLGDLGFAKES